MSASPAQLPTASVVVPTYNRPESLRTCLTRLQEQTYLPELIVVVDSSSDARTDEIVRQFPEVRYLRNPHGIGHLSWSRDAGLREVTSDVVAFVDDDAFARPEWLAELLVPYGDAEVGGVGGRVSNGVPGEAEPNGELIGAFLPDGTLTGNFSVDTGHVIEVDHFIGANMSFRRAALLAVGGIRDLYPGTCLREDTDTSLRVKLAGWKLVFTPSACVDHVSGTYAKGRRFDVRYTYFAQRNHIVLLTSVLGARSPELRSYLLVAASDLREHLRRAARSLRDIRVSGPQRALHAAIGALARAGACFVGVLAGLAAAARSRLTTATSPTDALSARSVVAD